MTRAPRDRVLRWLHGVLLRLRRRAPVLRQLAGPLAGLPALLFEAAGEGMLVIDRAGRVVRANATVRSMVGRGVDLAPGAPASPLFAEAAREQAEDELAAALAGRPPRPPFVTQLADAAGGPEAAVSASVVALRDPSVAGATASPGTVVGALLRLTDITLQRQLQAQLAQAQKLQALGHLAGGIAHDFNNLLTAVQGAAEAIAGRPGLDAETQDDLAQIRAGARRGAALVRQLLAFGRQQTLQPQVLAINDVITDLAAMLPRLLGRAIRVALDLEQPGRLVRADPSQLDQVLVNLAVNARDAMPQGGTLTIRSGHITLYRPLSGGAEVIPPGRYVMVEVQDTGQGIPPEVLPRIFDPFFTTKRGQGGHGLGLSTVHGIVRQSEGFLGVESEPGRGTSLRIYLPRFDGEAVAIPRPPAVVAVAAAEGAGAGRGTVLLVDDEAPVRRLAERALARDGWHVLCADSGEAALALLEPVPPPALAAVVTDMVMPGMDGAALVAAVRARLALPLLPALLVSGYADASLREALAQGQAIAFLAKPYALEQLRATLAAALAAASPRQPATVAGA